MKKRTNIITPDTTIKVNNLESGNRYRIWIVEQGGKPISDQETIQKGGLKFDLNGEIIYLYMSK